MELTRPDWTLFRTISGLCQKAGVSRERLTAVLVKELVDNSLDAAGDCRFGLIPESNGFWIEDHGPGFSESAEKLAYRFSVQRPLLSSKLWRKPKRGSLGHGLRLIAGAVLATDGRLVVQSKHDEILLRPRDNGKTDWRIIGPGRSVGCRIEMYLGDDLVLDESSLEFGRKALLLNQADCYSQKTQFQWYCSDSFYELAQNARHMSLRHFFQQFSQTQEQRQCLQQCLQQLGVSSSECVSTVTKDEMLQLFKTVRDTSPTFRPERLKKLGARSFLGDYYSSAKGHFQWRAVNDGVSADIPFIIELWSTPLEYGTSVSAYVNRSPVIWPSHAFQGSQTVIFQLNDIRIDIPSKFFANKGFALILNIDCPFIPLTSDGKTASFCQLHKALSELLSRHLKKIKKHWHNHLPNGERLTIRDVLKAHLLTAVDKASDGGRFRYSLRQLYYVMRPMVSALTGQNLNYNYFSRLISDYENQVGVIRGLYRDARGYLYHPHLRQRIPIGSRLIENYQQPPWTFNKVLYIEKKGLLETLCSVDWPERNDCAIIAAEGHATRADKDLIDFLAEQNSDLTIYCIHDADAYGTMIFEALQQETQARSARRVKIINLGLDPWEALELGLEPEAADNKRRAPVADYVADSRWRSWLQQYRVELNALRPEQFLEWLDYKLQSCAPKVVPPASILNDRLQQLSHSMLRKKIRKQLKIDQWMDRRIDQAWTDIEQCFQDILKDYGSGLESKIRHLINAAPEKLWLDHIESIAEDLSNDIAQIQGRGFRQLESLDWIR